MKLPGHTSNAGFLSGVFSRLGQTARAQEVLKELETASKTGAYIAPVEIAMTQFALGNKAEGLAKLQESIDARDFNLLLFLGDPTFDLVRDDPGFAALMDKIKVPASNWHDVPRYRKQ
jgi:hypothetical protein